RYGRAGCPRRSGPPRRRRAPRWSSVLPRGAHRALPAGRLGEADDGHDRAVPGRDERPAVALLAGHLRVHEHILHLTRAASEPVPGAPAPDDEARHAAFEPPRAPLDDAFEP